MSEGTKTYLTLDEEWPLELGEEVANPSRDRLPIVPDRVELAELFATEDELEQLAFRTLYESGLREAEFLALSREQLHEDFLDVAGRKALIGKDTMAQLHQLTNEGSLFGWEQAELRKRLRARARKTGLIERYEPIQRKLLPSMFRHAYAVHRLENGMDVFMVRALLGISSVYTAFKAAEMAKWPWGFVGTATNDSILWPRCRPGRWIPTGLSEESTRSTKRPARESPPT